MAVSAAAANSFKEFPRMIDKMVLDLCGQLHHQHPRNKASDITSRDTSERACFKKSDGYKSPTLGICKIFCKR